jgi:hypothetical protein
MTEVWESSSAKGGARLVLLALADHANDEGYCFPSVSRLARRSALSERNVQVILRDLETRGELVRLCGTGRGNVNQYWVLPPATVARLTREGKSAQNFHPLLVLEERVKAATQRVSPVSPRTVKNQDQPSTTQPASSEEKQRTPALTLEDAPQSSSADRTMLGAADARVRFSARRAPSAEADPYSRYR